MPEITTAPVRYERSAQGLFTPEHRQKINETRLDSVAPGNGVHLARDLEYIYSQVLETKYKPLSGLELFPVDSQVPEGANSYTIRRLDIQGDARYHRGMNVDVPSASVSQEEETRPVRHIISSIQLDYFEQQAASFSGTNIRAQMERAVRRGMDQFLNTKIFDGDEGLDVYGVLNYPWLPEVTSSIQMLPGTASSPSAILAELHSLADTNGELTDETFSPNTLLMPIAQYNYLSQTPWSTSSGTDKSILQKFTEDNDYIQNVRKVRELKGRGDGGADCFLFYRANDPMSVANVIPKGFTMLPAEVERFKIVIPVFMSHGGIIMRDVLNNLKVNTPGA